MVSGKIYIHILVLIQIKELVIIAFLIYKYRGNCGNYFGLGARFGALAIN